MSFAPTRPVPAGRSRLTAAAVTVVLATAVLPAVPAAADDDDLAQLHARLETPAYFDDKAGGKANADDPAIWNHPSDHRGDLVVGTLKQGGLAVYDAAGHEIQHLAAPAPPRPGDEPGRFNNVDLVYGFRLGGRKVDLAVVSDRGRDIVRTYAIDPGGALRHQAPLTDVTDAAAPTVFAASPDEVNDQKTSYGLASWTGEDGAAYAAVSRRHTTRVGVVRLEATTAGKITYRRVRDVDLPASFPLPGGKTWSPCEDPGRGPQVEGMVADQEHGVLYAAQEDVGIWRIPLKGGAPRLVDRVKDYGVPAAYNPETDRCEVTGPDPGYGGRHLTADAEGLTIYHKDDGEGYLLASSQGDNTFVAYDREDSNDYLGRFRVAPGGTVDGSEECDGAMVTSARVGDFRDGLLVVQDGYNAPDSVDENGEVRTNTNFKFVDWKLVAEPLDLDVTPGGWDPRDD
ncbi:phytase [Actinomadura macrotermitis]|uniref:3-phytase n=1 Tax=Actinomadura macrotermitis TaxID=2585200 RepID=A0A7K0C2L0_9ACTN|nr:phytase [Actinomadura macrotermitis]MQY07679.1 3-phytase [Actinomadura macrotermitis]